MPNFYWPSIQVFDLNQELTSNWLIEVCRQEKRNLEDINFIYLNDEELLEINVKYLNHDYFTDIITFDYCDEDRVSGDLYVSIERVKDNAIREKVTWQDELNRVMVHGILHLCGYADKSQDEEKLMRKKEDFYLNRLKGFT